MQISVVWTINARTASIDKAVANLAELKEEGFRRVWTTQMPNEPDALTMLTVAGREVPEIEFGTSVLPMQVQHPMLLAQRALTTQAIIAQEEQFRRLAERAVFPRHPPALVCPPTNTMFFTPRLRSTNSILHDLNASCAALGST